MSHLTDRNTSIVKQTAQKLWFDYCGIAKAEQLEEDAKKLEAWLNKGMHGTMQYMENYFDMRTDPRKLVPGAKSVITLLKNYFPAQQQKNNTPKIARYAYGKDYHLVIKQQLNEFLASISNTIGAIAGRGFVDSAPVLERAWAQKSGLGWIGKNGNLIHPKAGSFYFIATLITDLELNYDNPLTKDYCGTCTKCLDACPTDAILPNKTINGSQCISYFTIELKEMMIPETQKGKFNNWMFGCDICQEVCPWNRFSQPHNEPAFSPIPEILELSTQEWMHLSEAAFNQIFKHSPLKRSKYKGIQRNLRFIQSDTVIDDTNIP
ncbi:MAG: tRNA epoxyqueuosine(34) reductase QueG [Hydrotalea flava]|uniref:tRNA epoxyqueuosine(34) reductase QueG n=1 Tax=Hydrotalea TaxID=1004300 RepID=UPI001026BA35|nr:MULTISPECIES: tRNA epoxyqueuosine(34) reductase QueG [Hydrotalea]MBY0348707.1 tRNA epoxyqueuosine(34) reductase QueG [Hydrotalea flava]RWZ90808.1 MAG: tRNA epoxyqueuosine(34) reductase QueG [Hydrotalea sp. AMD]